MDAERGRLLAEFHDLMDTFSQREIAQKLDVIGRVSITPQQLHVLALVFLQARRASDIAGHLGVSAATVSGLLDRLEAGGLIQRVPDPGDGRGRLAQPTPEGLGLIRQIVESRRTPPMSIIDRVSTADLAAFVQGLGAFMRALDEAPAEA
jgi:DNA-binding MarR family transcriptional regulator